ncbi:cell division protein SepF [Actinopolyspora erythraea]|uniref:Cell division protein SepF n=1 Tax=Actinopolyspora erythraea TaxID=414996 RepID=A0A099D718_9ACTN|nr:cell division protein SepF [Actinopolyspora erythraea]ASU78230.1 cell division protein SepF [Actinopolyspora erythraea]KGI81819.1 cell division protein SepF [Actinopolyspora erythraea]
MSKLHKLKAYFGMVPAEEVDEYDEVPDGYASDYGEYDASEDRAVGPRRHGGTRGAQDEDQEDDHDSEPRSRVTRPRRQWVSESPVRGSLAVDPNLEQTPRLRAVTDTGSHYSLSKITTLHPRSYSEARTIGEQYRDGTPVIMNLTEMDEADAKRLVDFAAGLAFAMRGSIEKVTNRVFLLSPPNVDVAAEDKRRLAEGAFFNYG